MQDKYEKTYTYGSSTVSDPDQLLSSFRLLYFIMDPVPDPDLSSLPALLC
jgi:hypothetical protein